MLLSHPTDFWSGTGKGQAPAAGVCLQMFPAGRRFQCPGAVPGHPAPPSPASHGARGSHPRVRNEAGTLRHRLARRWFSLLSDPRGQELSFLPGTPARWERLGSPMAVRVSQLTRQQHRPPGLHSSSKSAPDQSPSRLFLAAGNGSWGEQEQSNHLRCCPEYC